MFRIESKKGCGAGLAQRTRRIGQTRMIPASSESLRLSRSQSGIVGFTANRVAEPVLQTFERDRR